LTVFRWTNCRADIEAAKHGFTAQIYLDEVIRPGVAALEARIVALGKSEDPGDLFLQGDVQEVLRETKLGFSLSLQSVWERQLRRYLTGCAEALRPGSSLSAKVARADWPALQALFHGLRGIQLKAFPSFPELDTLQLLGNACRHGDGPSLRALARRCPDLWPWPWPDPPPPSAAGLDVPLDRLERFVAALADFWADATYIYNESIEPKPAVLEARLAEERATRAWRPQAES
jgi:hypothetical protein